MSEADSDGQLRLTPSLLRAIEDHKYLRSCETCRELDLGEAAREFRRRHEQQWSTTKLRADNARQAQEMQRHLWIESEKAGHDVGRSAAGTEWVSRFARTWRRERESLRGNDFLDREIVVPASSDLERRGMDAVLERITGLSCDVFVSQDGIPDPDFYLKPEPEAAELGFVHLRATRVAASYGLAHTAGARLLFVAYGKHAVEALAAVQEAARLPVAAR